MISCHQDRTYTYAELRNAANQVARALMALGVECGDRVGIWSANQAEWMITQYAVAKAGAILVNLNPAYRSREQEHGCTSIYGVPTMFIALLSVPDFGRSRLNTLRTGIMAGASCPIDVMRQVIERMHVPEVTICYGMTETSPVSFQSATDDPVELRVSTVGRVLPHVECKIVDLDTGSVVPRGIAGRAVHPRV